MSDGFLDFVLFMLFTTFYYMYLKSCHDMCVIICYTVVNVCYRVLCVVLVLESIFHPLYMYW